MWVSVNSNMRECECNSNMRECECNMRECECNSNWLYYDVQVIVTEYTIM